MDADRRENKKIVNYLNETFFLKEDQIIENKKKAD